MVSIPKNTVTEIRQVLESEQKPKWNLKILLNEIKTGIRYQRKVAQKDFMEQCLRRILCIKEIISLARQVRSIPGRKEDRDRIEEKRILRIGIEEMKKDLETEKDRWTQESKEVRKTIKLSSEASDRMRMIKSSVFKVEWNNCKERLQRKLNMMIQKQNPIKKSMPGVLMDILIETKELEDRYGEISLGSQ